MCIIRELLTVSHLDHIAFLGWIGWPAWSCQSGRESHMPWIWRRARWCSKPKEEGLGDSPSRSEHRLRTGGPLQRCALHDISWCVQGILHPQWLDQVTQFRILGISDQWLTCEKTQECRPLNTLSVLIFLVLMPSSGDVEWPVWIISRVMITLEFNDIDRPLLAPVSRYCIIKVSSSLMDGICYAQVHHRIGNVIHHTDGV